MSGFELVAGVIGVFFVAGIAVGVLLVMALPVLRDAFLSLFWPHRDDRRHLDDGAVRRLPRRDDEEKPPWWHAG